MNLRSRAWVVCALLLPACGFARAQSAAAPSQAKPPAPAAAARVLLVLPFENAGADPRLDWIGEGLAELSIERMSLPGVVTYPRADWLAAMEKLGLPASSRFTRATMLKIAQQIDADFVMSGRYSIDTVGLNVTANVLRVSPSPALSPALREFGPLQDLMEIHARLAWQALRYIDRDFPLSQHAYMQRLPRVRLPAFEAHVRGLLAGEPAQRLNFFREAARLEPEWDEPIFALGREYFSMQNCASALIWFSKIVPANARGPEAEFYAGLCHLRGNDPPRAEAAFRTLLQRGAAVTAASAEPCDAGMQDVLNNLAVAESRQGKWREASAHWQRAQQLEPGHAGYWFNYAVGALRAGEMSSAARGLREALRRNAEDSEARALLIVVLERAGRATEAAAEREACEEDCTPTPAIRAIWKAPKGPGPASLEALAKLDRLSDNPELSVRHRDDVSPPAATPPRSSLRLGSASWTGGRP